jgi:sec-independent protein translocase protein TatC
MFKNVIFDKIILAPRSPEFFTNRVLCRLGEIVHINALCINTDPALLISIKMAGQITTHITVALVAGLILAFPMCFMNSGSFSGGTSQQ